MNNDARGLAGHTLACFNHQYRRNSLGVDSNLGATYSLALPVGRLFILEADIFHFLHPYRQRSINLWLQALNMLFVFTPVCLCEAGLMLNTDARGWLLILDFFQSLMKTKQWRIGLGVVNDLGCLA